MTEAIPLALLGAGWVFRNAYLPHLRRGGSFRPVALFDSHRERALQASSELDVPVVADLAGMRSAGAAAVLIATPNPTHVDLARQALMAGLTVICEKPVAVTRAHAAELLAALDLGGQRIFACSVMRYRRDIQEWMELCRRSGPPAELQLLWVRGQGAPANPWALQGTSCWTGVLPDLGYHLLDLAHAALGPPGAAFRIEFAEQTIGAEVPSADWYGKAGVQRSQVPHDCRVLLDWAGVRVTLRVSWADGQTGDLTRLEFRGQSGRVIFEGLLGMSSQRRAAHQTVILKDAHERVVRKVAHPVGATEQLNAFGSMLEQLAHDIREGIAPDHRYVIADLAMVLDRIFSHLGRL